MRHIVTQYGQFCMTDKSWILTGWPTVPVFLTVASTPVLTALVISMPVAWLVNHIFSANLIRTLFGVEQLGYWRVVGLFAIVFATRFKVNIRSSSG
jgi:hypothetical protein